MVSVDIVLALSEVLFQKNEKKNQEKFRTYLYVWCYSKSDDKEPQPIV